jgi:phospholipid-binding lipoprotein MlaA
MARPSQTASFKSLLPLILLTILLGGCAKHSADIHEPTADALNQESFDSQVDDEFELEAEFEAETQQSVIDPLSGYNRVMTHVNDKLYFWLLKPVAQGYSFVMPEGARLAVGRFFKNLLMPVRFANNLLQLKPKRAGTELARFAINTTIGVLGFGDPAAKHFDLQPYPEDFGQTLGHYGVGSGFHIVLPLLGPSNLRDTIGLIPDHFLDPVTYIDNSKERLAVRAYKQVNHTSLHIGEYESLKLDAVDLYTFLRDGYEQRRAKQVEE